MDPVFFTDRDLGNIVPDALRDAGFRVERHADHFAPAARDTDWLRAVGRRGWYVLTRDHRIRYRPNELTAVMEAGVGLFVLIGAVPHAALAANFVATRRRIQSFLERTKRPFIAKVYLPSPAEHRRSHPAGRVDLWMDSARWRARPGSE